MSLTKVLVMYVRMYSICMYRYVCMYVCMYYECMDVCMCTVCMYVCMYVSASVDTYIHTYIHTFIPLWQGEHLILTVKVRQGQQRHVYESRICHISRLANLQVFECAGHGDFHHGLSHANQRAVQLLRDDDVCM